MLGVVALIGEHGPDPGHDRVSGQEQALEDQRVVDVGGGGHTRDRHTVPIHRDIVLRAPLGPIGRVGSREIPCALGAHRATVQDQVGMAPQHANQQGVHLRQHTRLGPACEPPPQGRAAGLRRCRGQAAPGRALAQEPPQGGQHSDRLGRRMAATALPGWITVVDDRRKQAQDPDIQGSLPCLASQTWASAAARSVASQSTVVVKTAS